MNTTPSSSPHSPSPWVRRLGSMDFSICLLFNRGVHRPRQRRFFAFISRLGDGIVWYVLMGILPLMYGTEAMGIALHMGLVAAAGVVIYKWIKHHFIRERPFVTHTVIQRGTYTLDRYGFPSGHTLHAVAFAILITAYFPGMAWLIIPFSALIAASRMVLGLHYPSDVLMGAAIGALLAWSSLLLPGF